MEPINNYLNTYEQYNDAFFFFLNEEKINGKS